MGQLAKLTHEERFELTTNYIKNATVIRNRQVVAGAFDTCRFVIFEGSTGGQVFPDGFEIGEIRVFSFAFSKAGYFPCDGRTLSRFDYPVLFDRIGYKYGGVGASFKIPNYQSRVLQGETVAEQVGIELGAESVSINHTHDVDVSIDDHTITPSGSVSVTIEPTEISLTIDISGTTSDDTQDSSYPVSIEINDKTISKILEITGNTQPVSLILQNSDLENHTDLIMEDGQHTHDVTIPNIKPSAGELNGGDSGTFPTTGHQVQIDLSKMGQALSGLEHSFVGGQKDLSHSHVVELSYNFTDTHTHTASGSVEINRTHNHTFSGSDTKNLTHLHSSLGSFKGNQESLSHNIDVTEGVYAKTINLHQPTTKVYYAIKVE